MFASCTGYTRLMSKTNCPSKLPCSLDIWGNIQRNTKPEYFTASGSASVSQELEGTLWTLIWQTYDTYLSRQLGQANSMIPWKTPHVPPYLWIQIFRCQYITWSNHRNKEKQRSYGEGSGREKNKGKSDIKAKWWKWEEALIEEEEEERSIQKERNGRGKITLKMVKNATKNHIIFHSSKSKYKCICIHIKF